MGLNYMDLDGTPGGPASPGERLFLLALVCLAIIVGVWILETDNGEPAHGTTTTVTTPECTP